MILRRVLIHFKKQEWTAIFLDFLIVVAGVFIGLQANTWKEARGDRVEAGLLISRLAQEYDLIDSRMDGQIDHYYDNMVLTNAVIEYAAGERSMDHDELKLALRKISTRRLPPRRSATFTAMLSSGKVDLLDDKNLLSVLVVYDNQAEMLAEVFTFNSGIVQENEGRIFQNVRFETNPELSSIDNIGPIRSVDIDAFLGDQSVLPALQAIYGAHENMHVLLKLQRQNVDEVRRLLSEAMQ